MRRLNVFCVVLAILGTVNVANGWFENCSVVKTIAAGGTLTLSNPNVGNNRSFITTYNLSGQYIFYSIN